MTRAPRKSTYLRQSATTIRDVAREAGVSIGTASRVFTGSPRVKAETREKVLDVAKRLGFHPNPTARALARGRTNTIGVLVPFFFTRQNHVEMVRGVQAGIADSEYSLAICSVERPEQARAEFAAFQTSGRVDGLIIISLAAGLLPADLSDTSMPMLCVDTMIPGVPCIIPDHENGAFLATTHLIEQHGHRLIAFIDRPQDPVSHATSPARRRGFLKAHEQLGLAAKDELITLGGYAPEGGYNAARDLLDLPEPPTAFVCASDLQAIGVLRAARELNLRIGRDLAVVGYNDVLIAEYLGLSTVHVPSFQIGRQATASLLALINEAPRPSKIATVEPRLVMRTSCGCGE